jgi:hypothetical protein
VLQRTDVERNVPGRWSLTTWSVFSRSDGGPEAPTPALPRTLPRRRRRLYNPFPKMSLICCIDGRPFHRTTRERKDPRNGPAIRSLSMARTDPQPAAACWPSGRRDRGPRFGATG